MGLYSKFVFPRICDLILGRTQVGRHRRELLESADGEVLEIGFGTGLNLAHYPTRINKITTVEPNSGMSRLAKDRIGRRGIEVDLRMATGEKLPFDDRQFDCVVSTFTLCSVQDAGQVVAELHRVLKPSGKFLFMEHGLCPEANVQKWQRRLNWLEMKLADGCRLDRNIREIVSTQPFSSTDSTEFYLEKTPKLLGYIYRGVATK